MKFVLVVPARNINIVTGRYNVLSERYEVISQRIKAALAKEIFFVVGAPKSGTTWLQKMLDTHPDILCSGEGHFRRFIAEFGHIIKNYNQGQATIANYVYEGNPCYAPFSDEMFDFLVTDFVCLMLGQRLSQKNATFIGDKTPLHVESMETLLTLFPSAKFIHIIRDGRDMAISITRHSDRMANRPTTATGQDIFYECIKEAAQRWHNAIQAALAFKQKFPAHYHELHYRDLKQSPLTTMEKVVTFLGAASSPDILTQMIEANRFEILAGRTSGTEDVTSFYRKGIVGDWVNHFDTRAIEIFNQYAGQSLEAVGYDVVASL